jgi:hypothetical protein
MILCDELFGKAHHRSNKTNAFRHALWNVLICHNTLRKTQNTEKSILWTEKVTNLYEKVTDNGKIEEVMDLHNNKVGLNLFLSVFDKKEDEIINILQNMMGKSKKVNDIHDFEKFKHHLVYLE